jgi:hypothetical protein
MPAAAAHAHPTVTFSHRLIDFMRPLQYSGGFNFIFTVIDRTSKWTEAVPLSDTSAAACAKALIFSLISCFGVPGAWTPLLDHQGRVAG